MVQLSHLHMTIGKPYVWLYGMTAVNICSDFGSKEKKICYCFHFFPSICHEMMGPDVMISVYWMLSFKPAVSLSSFPLIKRLFMSSPLSAISEILFAYLRFLGFFCFLFLFLQTILIPACDSSSSAFRIMYFV